MKNLQRSIEKELLEAAAQFPALQLTGPRQSGKTTLLRHLFGATHHYVSLDDVSARSMARQNPTRFFREHPAPVIVDEVQYAPELLSTVKIAVDRNRGSKGRFLLTGSQNFSVSATVKESLAGRVGVLRLLPLSRGEIQKQPFGLKLWQQGFRAVGGGWPGFWDQLCRGFYPEPARMDGKAARRWQESYVETYLERDVRDLRHVGDLMEFRNFMRLLALRSGSQVDLSEMAGLLGVSVNTVKAWLSVLEASYQIQVVRPYFNNFGKRLVKRSKVYFMDTGILCFLAGLKNGDEARQSALAGALMETYVAADLAKGLANSGPGAGTLHYWRTSDGDEVDFIVADGAKLWGVEAKATAKPSAHDASGLRKFARLAGEDWQGGFVVHSGSAAAALPGGDSLVPASRL